MMLDLDERASESLSLSLFLAGQFLGAFHKVNTTSIPPITISCFHPFILSVFCTKHTIITYSITVQNLINTEIDSRPVDSCLSTFLLALASRVSYSLLLLASSRYFKGQC